MLEKYWEIVVMKSTNWRTVAESIGITAIVISLVCPELAHRPERHRRGGPLGPVPVSDGAAIPDSGNPYLQHS